jgi:hypothetical protein
MQTGICTHPILRALKAGGDSCAIGNKEEAQKLCDMFRLLHEVSHVLLQTLNRHLPPKVRKGNAIRVRLLSR